MEIHSAGRGTGKTKRMVEWLKENLDAILVVPTYDQKNYIMQHFFATNKERGEIGHRIVVAGDRHSLRGSSRRLVGVDNLDQVIAMLLGAPVERATVTEE